MQAVPPVLNYAGQVAINNKPFDGNGLFKFALVNSDGNATYWSNDGTSTEGLEPLDSVSISVNGGLYAVLLGNTALEGMAKIEPTVFAQNTDTKLRVWFSDGKNGFQQLSPDRPFASVPYAFYSGLSSSTNIAPGTIGKEQLSKAVVKFLMPEITSQPSALRLYAHENGNLSLSAQGKYLAYQWRKDGLDLHGETNATLFIKDASAENHDGNYSAVVSNDFGRLTSADIEVLVSNWSPLAISGLKLWLDASGLNVSESYWSDKSGKGNNALKQGNPVVVPGVQNGKSIMRYSGTDNEFHSFSKITDIRTVFWVIEKVGVANNRFLLGNDNSNFHSGENNKIFHPSSVNNFELLKINGLAKSIPSSTFPASLSIISLKTKKNLSATSFSRDRNYSSRVWKGDLAELLIYNTSLSDTEIILTEGYLAHKWGLSINLPSNHTYKNVAP